uniref:F-box protein AT5G49610-like beta-propeller domain-containing protein n=1 Tax=Aegilops tauschii TaxID=37682 RepID=R7WCX5_AEGTA
MPQPSELADVTHRASFQFNTYKYHSIGLSIVDCWGGNVFVTLHKYDTGKIEYPFAVHRPLFLPTRKPWCVNMLQDGVWCMHTSGTTEVHGIPRSTKLVLVYNKVYICSGSYVLVFDLKTASFSKIQYPLGVGFHEAVMLSRADDDSGVYLVHAEEFQLDIWLHKGDNWLLVDTIYLRGMYPYSSMLDHILAVAHNTDVRISQVGANAEFVFLQMGNFILYLDIKCRTLHKAYEMTAEAQSFSHQIQPFMMIWSPTFPALKDDHIRFAYCPLDDFF